MRNFRRCPSISWPAPIAALSIPACTLGGDIMKIFLLDALQASKQRSFTASTRCRLVQWCHGAPGMLITLASLHTLFGSAFPFEFQRLMPLSGDNVWQRGLLKKGLGLCHGIAGNGYAFLSAYRATSDASFLQQAQAFGLYSAEVCLPS